MPLQAYLIFLVFSGFSGNVKAVYEHNPFFQGEHRPPGLVQPLPTPTNKPSVTQPPFTILASQPSTTTKEPLFTIEPLELLQGTKYVPKKCPKPRGQFPSSSCNTYVNCWDGVAIEQRCLGNYLFNPVKLYCDFPENVDCQGKPIIRATSIPTELPNNEVTLPVSLDHPQAVTSTFTAQGPNLSLRKLCTRSTGLFPGSSCGKFVNCWADNAVEQDCPAGLYFSSEGYCDYPENVHCDGHNSNGVVPTRVNEKNSDCLLEFGNFRNRSDCSQYYTCAFNKVAARYHCPDGFRFSDLLGICDYSYRVDCSKEPQAFDVRKRVGGINLKHSDCPLEFGNFRNTTNCSEYFSCAFYKVTARYKCPEGLSFSDLLGLCDYSYRVNCSKEPQVFQKDANNIQGQKLSFNAFAHPDLFQPASKDVRCVTSNGLVRDQENCSTYYVCDSGKVVANYVCPSGFKFSNELGVCDYEQNVDCNIPGKAYEIGSSNAIVPNLSQEVLSQVQRCVPGSVFRLNPECTSACLCRDGIAEIIQCSAGLAYDSKTNKCILAHLARC